MTLIELMIVVTIIATIASIGTSMYGSALLSARFIKAKSELRTISLAISTYQSTHQFELPRTLADAGHGNRLDPWGFPYMYLNFHTGTGSGMQYVTEAGLIDPVAVARIKGVRLGGQGTVGAVTDAAPLDLTLIDEHKRKDRLLFPLNSDYDLFSVGPNGVSALSLGEKVSLDDVIRANDGNYFGLASKY